MRAIVIGASLFISAVSFYLALLTYQKLRKVQDAFTSAALGKAQGRQRHGLAGCPRLILRTPIYLRVRPRQSYPHAPPSRASMRMPLSRRRATRANQLRRLIPG